MKACFKFDMDVPEDRDQFKLHNQAGDMLFALMGVTGRYGFVNEGTYGFKDLLKYDKFLELIKKAKEDNKDHSLENIVFDVISQMEDNFYAILHEHEVDLDAIS